MNITTKVVSTILVPLAFTCLFVVPVHAAAECSIKMVGTVNSANQSGSRWTVDTKGLATGTVIVSGDKDCQQTVTLAAWQAPDANKGRPYDQQKLVNHATATFGIGAHSLSIQTPDCFYQLDMVPGSNPAGINGTAQYPTGTLIGSLHGGSKTCEVTPPVTPPQTPTPPTLPNTGIGSNIAIFGVAATVAGTLFQYFRRLRTA